MVNAFTAIFDPAREYNGTLKRLRIIKRRWYPMGGKFAIRSSWYWDQWKYKDWDWRYWVIPSRYEGAWRYLLNRHQFFFIDLLTPWFEICIRKGTR